MRIAIVALVLVALLVVLLFFAVDRKINTEKSAVPSGETDTSVVTKPSKPTSVAKSHAPRATKRPTRDPLPVNEVKPAYLQVQVIGPGFSGPAENAKLEIEATYADKRVEALLREWTTTEKGEIEQSAPGVFRLKVPAGKAYRIRAIGGKGGARTAWQEVSPLDPSTECHLVLELPGIEVPFFCRVITMSSGQPIVGARIRCDRRRWISEAETLKTDSSGMFSITAQATDSIQISVEAEGYERVQLGFSTNHQTRATACVVKLRSGGSLSGVVIDASGQAINRALVRVECDSMHQFEAQRAAPEMFRFALTNARGEYAIRGLPAGTRITLQVHLLEEDFWGASAESRALSSWQKQGIVGDNDQDESMIRWLVKALGGPVMILQDRRIRLVYHTTEPLVLKPGESRRIDVQLKTPSTVHGQVTDQNGAPVGGVEVGVQRAVDGLHRLREFFGFVVRADVTTDGFFTLGEVPAGRWAVGVLLPESSKARQRIAAPVTIVDVPGGGTSIEINLRVFRDLSITGRVIAKRDLLLERGLQLVATQIDNGYRVFGNVRENGSFSISPLVPGPYWIFAIGRTSCGSDQIVRAGARDVVLRLDVGSSVTGRVVDRLGQPCGARVNAVEREGRLDLEIGSDSAGQFQFPLLQTGTYDIFARSDDGCIGVAQGIEVAPAAPVAGVVVRLEPAGRLAVRVSGPGERYLVKIFSRKWRISLRPQWVPANAIVMMDVPDGLVDVEVRLGSGQNATEAARKTATAMAGKETPVQFIIKE